MAKQSWKTDKELVNEIQYGSTREAKNAALTEMKQREAARAAARSAMRLRAAYADYSDYSEYSDYSKD